MSKRRQELDLEGLATPIATEPQNDLQPFVVFTQLKDGGPFIYAGWLDAADAKMAQRFAINHYGRDQACTQIWVAPREFVGGMRQNAEEAKEPVRSARPYQIFIQQHAGDQHISSMVIEATSASEAIRRAHSQCTESDEPHNLWAIPRAAIATTDEAALVWKNLDQSYRLARGYSKPVRQKWERIRSKQELEAYEKDDLHDTF